MLQATRRYTVPTQARNDHPPTAHLVAYEADWLAHLPLKGYVPVCSNGLVLRTSAPPTATPTARVCPRCLKALGEQP